MTPTQPSPEALAAYREAERPCQWPLALVLGLGLLATLTLAACLAAAGCYGIYLAGCELASQW